MKLCEHFGECGGCTFQDIPYQEQLCRKENKIKELAVSYNLNIKLRPINHYEQYFYRNKMEFTFSQEEELVCGLHSKKYKRKVIDIKECLIFSSDLGKILEEIKEFAKEKKYSVYNKLSHQGFLRHLIIREAKFTNQIMVGIVTSSAQSLDKEEFIKRLVKLKLKSELKSVYWIINDALSDAVIFQKKELLYGEPFIQEELGSLKFNIGIDSFFQVNPKGIKDLYSKIENCVGLNPSKKVLDLYCGVGCIGIFLAKNAKFVWGVELKEEIVEAAWGNAIINKVKNISFFVYDTRKFLSSQGAFYKNIDILVINPPRCGLSKKVIRGILRLNPWQIVYSSCNPSAFFIDTQGFLQNYNLKLLEPFDFFPHTPHVEILGVFSKKGENQFKGSN